MEIERLYGLYRNSAGVTTDSRAVKKGELFFALKGPSHDGNRYAAAALEAGDGAGAVAPLSPTFRVEGPEGPMDRAQLRLLFMGLLRQGRPGITLLRVEGRREGDSLLQEVDALLSLSGERSRRRWLLTWKEEDGTWRVVRAQAME